MSDRDAARAVHEAVGGYLREGEIAVAWCMTIEVAGPNDARYLAHRAGGGHDGTDGPTLWTALGMLRADVLGTEDQLREITQDSE